MDMEIDAVGLSAVAAVVVGLASVKRTKTKTVRSLTLLGHWCLPDHWLHETFSEATVASS